jgi:cellulose synthase/poly-beta-1,6-N-acetylglucosamine synthase-like glycosyltransferase
MSAGGAAQPEDAAAGAVGGIAVPFAALPARPEALRPTPAPPRRRGDSLADFVLLPELDDWAGVFDRLGLSHEQRARAAIQARMHRVSLQREIVASDAVGEEHFYRALAEDLGLEYLSTLRPDRLALTEAQALMLLRRAPGAQARLIDGRGEAVTLLATDRLDIVRLKARLAATPGLATRFKVVAPSLLRSALLDRVRPALAANAANGLFNARPEMSGRNVTNGWQGFLIGLGGGLFLVSAIVQPLATLAGAQLFFTLFFLGCVFLRLLAMTAAPGATPTPIRPFTAAELPVYTVLVALYRETEIVPELLVALGRLQWPRARLEIKLVCEADDAATLAAIRAHPLRSFIEIVEVPAGGPRTKPKALSYALPVTSGELVALYDAEDKPHPLQLLEAWQRFGRAPPEVACVQAPLEISNGGTGIMARLFALEYAALFHGLLPFLARRKLLLPLGGTSNHFRRAALEEVGAWDPYNVTEDADLAVRLRRAGYRTEMIGFSTREAAPRDLATWLPQRTRWFKGWLLTWLVHMRDPLLLWREIGPGSFVVYQLLFVGLALSTIAHPLMLVTGAWIAVSIAMGEAVGVRQHQLLLVDVANIACGYASFLLLGWQALPRQGRRGFWKAVLFTPAYWLLMTVATLRALVQLRRRPHFWDKTHHPKTGRGR